METSPESYTLPARAEAPSASEMVPRIRPRMLADCLAGMGTFSPFTRLMSSLPMLETNSAFTA